MKLSSRIVTTNRTLLFLGNGSLSFFDRFVASLHPSAVYIHVDSNTRTDCLPVFLEKVRSLKEARVVETESGEASKTIDSVCRIWTFLANHGADRASLLVNLGGGVVSDLGGFAAAGYHRGIGYINVPTSLIGQADAAIGGKTGINFGSFKNQIGSFSPAKAVFIRPEFLATLPADHLRSGLAEIVKSALAGDLRMWKYLRQRPVDELLQIPAGDTLWEKLIFSAVTFKNRVVTRDFRERKLRQILNFGHTIGHALEGYALSSRGEGLLHGDAVAAGMICAAYLSFRKAGLQRSSLEMIAGYLSAGFPNVPVSDGEMDDILEYIASDKKARKGIARFTLLAAPGSPVLGVPCSREEIRESLEFYRTTLRNHEVDRHNQTR